ncbi:hypothetical protein EON76_00690 [bacterium]|nr:MAG: hypothetical protein EON76_00690 [bacterium]
MKAFGHIVNRRMSRADFLKSIGIIAVAVLGFGNVITLLSEHRRADENDSHTAGSTPGHGFGSSKFGV